MYNVITRRNRYHIGTPHPRIGVGLDFPFYCDTLAKALEIRERILKDGYPVKIYLEQTIVTETLLEMEY